MKTQLLRLNGELSGRNGILKRSVLAQQDCGSLRAPADISGPVLRALPSLRGKNLACWCPLPKAGEPDNCHAAVLLELANR